LDTAHTPWLDWDGRADSLWAQALEPIDHSAELAIPRSVFVARLLARDGQQYNAVFGAPASLPPPEALLQVGSPLGDAAAQRRRVAWSAAKQQAIDEVFSRAGKALMAYQRQLRFPQAPFDRFVDALVAGQDADALRRLLSPTEWLGCACSWAGPTAPAATTARCSPTSSFITWPHPRPTPHRWTWADSRACSRCRPTASPACQPPATHCRASARKRAS